MCYRKTFSSRKICYNSHFSLLHVYTRTEKPNKILAQENNYSVKDYNFLLSKKNSH